MPYKTIDVAKALQELAELVYEMRRMELPATGADMRRLAELGEQAMSLLAGINKAFLIQDFVVNVLAATGRGVDRPTD